MVASRMWSTTFLRGLAKRALVSTLYQVDHTLHSEVQGACEKKSSGADGIIEGQSRNESWRSGGVVTPGLPALDIRFPLFT